MSFIPHTINLLCYDFFQWYLGEEFCFAFCFFLGFFVVVVVGGFFLFCFFGFFFLTEKVRCVGIFP